MDTKLTEEKLDSAVERFVKTFKEFEKAAQELLEILKAINQKKYNGSNAFLGESERIYNFVIQTLGDNEHIVEKTFNVKFEADNDK